MKDKELHKKVEEIYYRYEMMNEELYPQGELKEAYMAGVMDGLLENEPEIVFNPDRDDS